MEADGRLQPARIGCGWGESTIGVYRRETRDGRDVLGEVPDHPIDPSVGVIRVDDLDGNPIAVAFRYSAHPVTVGGRSAGRLRGLPRPGQGGARAQPRRPRPLPPRLRRQHQPPRRHRLRSRLPRHQKPRRPRTRRRSPQDRRRHPHQHPRRTTPTARQRPQHPLHPLGTRPRQHLHPPHRHRNHHRPRLRRPSLAGHGQGRPREMAGNCRGRAQRPRTGMGAPRSREDGGLGAATARRRRGRRSDVRPEAPGDTRGRHRDRGHERGDVLRDGPRDPRPFAALRHVRARLHERLDGVLAASRGSPERRLEARRAVRAARTRSRSSIQDRSPHSTQTRSSGHSRARWR